VDTLSYKTISPNAASIEQAWYVVDAENKVLGRLASEVAKIIRGKHKPAYSPHVNCGDQVIVVNAEKVRLTGKKFDNKSYIRYSGYPGGQRSESPRQLMSKDPRRVVEKAVKGMLPKNRLGSALFGNLHVYAGQDHPHAAQQPKELKF
jgi:large subunit ribosomal protein L13